MNKINCDVCGTKYPENAEQCPICGCARAAGARPAEDEVVLEEELDVERERVRGGRFSKSNVRKRNKNAVRYESHNERVRDQEPDEEEEVAARGGSNAVLNVLLVIVIIALLLVTGYIFVKYFLPDIKAGAETTPTTEVTEATEDTTPTEEPTVPCTGLELVNGGTEVVLTEIGQAWLLNVRVLPEDCSDELVFNTSDMTVAMVDSQGTITAMGEGEAIVIASCGGQTLEFNVSCSFINETEPEETEPEETTPVTEAPTEPPLKDVELKVNKTDMTFKMIGQEVTLKVANGLTAQEVTWKSENEKIITVDENGLVTCVGWGTTNIIVSYGDQEVTVVCRCKK